jgi:hypothetical protein
VTDESELAGSPLDVARALLAADAETTRLRGVHALRDDVADRSAAAEVLVSVLSDPGSYVPHAARAALQDLGDAARDALLDGLHADGAVVRAGCAWALATPQSGDVTPQLSALASDTELAVREAVAGALGRVGGECRPRELVLAALAEDREPRVRTQAIQSLGLLTEHSSAGRTALTDAVEDSRPAVRIAAVEALANLVPDAAAIAHVTRALDEEPSEQVAAPLRALLEHWRRAT